MTMFVNEDRLAAEIARNLPLTLFGFLGFALIIALAVIIALQYALLITLNNNIAEQGDKISSFQAKRTCGCMLEASRPVAIREEEPSLVPKHKRDVGMYLRIFNARGISRY